MTKGQGAIIKIDMSTPQVDKKRFDCFETDQGLMVAIMDNPSLHSLLIQKNMWTKAKYSDLQIFIYIGLYKNVLQKDR